MQTTKLLRRSKTDRIFAGVAGGLGNYTNIVPALIRLGWVALALLGGAGIMAYLLAWAIIPDQDGRRTIVPVLLLILGLLFPIICVLTWLIPVTVTTTR
jgi:phage shock protein PspC (stress-responsive transcriptional regulator)